MSASSTVTSGDDGGPAGRPGLAERRPDSVTAVTAVPAATPRPVTAETAETAAAPG
ncbi:MAG: hypothetical protein ACLP3C_14445 [Mycobacterium sp.]|uniref:hypothetical protein n=1 Tax=Mycobacterium sp. TaxID=1785 RepID=UPI003F9C1BA2